MHGYGITRLHSIPNAIEGALVNKSRDWYLSGRWVMGNGNLVNRMKGD